MAGNASVVPGLAMTGMSGFVGTSVARQLAARCGLFDLYHRSPGPEGLATARVQLRADDVAEAVAAARAWGAVALVHNGAVADVDACERERGDRRGSAYQANVVLPGALARACAEQGMRFVHVSTDYVFNGARGPYREDDVPAEAANWYGQTKLEGERAVLDANPAAAVVRIALPYGEDHPRKRDIVRLVRGRLAAGQPFGGAVDQHITPTWMGDIADGLAALALSGGAGIYHLAGATILTPYDAALVVARTFGLEETLVQPSTLTALTQAGRAPRPGSTALLCARFQGEFGERVRLKGFAEGVGLLRREVSRPECVR